MAADDTIVALSSGALPSGVAVVRVSGAMARKIAERFAAPLPPPRQAALRRIHDGDVPIDQGLVLWMPGPQSFTGEDCLEVQLHGSRAVVQSLLRRIVEIPGCRLAEAGEFTRRAFENGKLDLTEAQGLGDLIEAETENQRAIAYARMEGGLTRRIEGWRERLLDLRAHIEAQLDFSDEGDVGALPPSFLDDVEALAGDIDAVLAQSDQGRIIRSGFRVVLAGPPNAGKSSLLNALSHSDVAIVSDEAGTTRDLKEVPLDVKGQLVLLIDSAGLRETTSKAEAIGVERARAAMRHADLVVWLMAPDVPETPPDLSDGQDEPLQKRPVLHVATKSDLGPVVGAEISVSATTGAGIADLLDRLYSASGAATTRPADILVSHEQDRAALLGAAAELRLVGAEVDRSELAAERLRRAGLSLERLLGRMDAENVLDRLFSTFCIGK
jgi:tRNA modification GTPase